MSLNKTDEIVFEDSLLIIKSVYLHKRRQILLKLLSKGFQIQGNRRLLFSPEKAAEFYRGGNENKDFMLLVIMLSEGTSEAFILARQNCVIELLNTMICYFCNSKEMEKNVHVSRSPDAAHFEISYIFPNYIHEPLPIFYDVKFPNSLLVKDIMTEAYNIASDPYDARRNWKKKMIEWLNVSNSGLPRISHQCKPRKPTDDKGVTAIIPIKPTQPPAKESPSSSVDQIVSLSSGGSSALITSSSCITCSCFDGEDTCYRTKKADSLEVIVAKKKTRLSSSSLSVTSDRVCEEAVEWREIGEESIGSLSEKSCLEEHVGPPSAFLPQDSEGGGSLIIKPPGENPLTSPEDGGVTVTKEVGPDGTVTEVITFIESPSGPAEITEIVAEAEYGEPLYEKVEDLFEEAQEIMENDEEVSPDGVIVNEMVTEGEDGAGLGAKELYAKAEELVEENVDQQGIAIEVKPDEAVAVATTNGDEQPPPPE